MSHDTKTNEYIKKRGAEIDTKEPNLMKFSPLDLVPLIVNEATFFQYLIGSGWIASIVQGKCTGKVSFDETTEIYHEVVLMIYDKMHKIIELYEEKGLLSALVYARTIAVIQGNPLIGSSVYNTKVNKRKLDMIYMTPEMMSDIDECYNPDIDEIYHLSNTFRLYDKD